MITALIPEQHQRLGRHIEHDPASFGFAAAQAPTIKSVLHKRLVPAFDQGNLGSCTAHAAAGLMVTAPDTVKKFDHSEAAIVAAYEWQTHHDSVPGSYPPDDTGSSGLAAAKYLKHLGVVKSYAHAFGLQHALSALVLGPVITGVNWYDSFDRPDSNGLVSISPNAGVRGGHEFEGLGIDIADRHVQWINSWGPLWGNRGRFMFSWETWDRLLHEQGDVTTVLAA